MPYILFWSRCFLFFILLKKTKIIEIVVVVVVVYLQLGEKICKRVYWCIVQNIVKENLRAD